MKVKLPTCKSEIIDNKVVFTYGEIDVTFDFSVWAEERWEVNFPANAQKETLMKYIERVAGNKNAVGSVAVISILKPIYCLIDEDDIGSFKDFCRMFDLSNVEFTKNLCIKLCNFLDIALSASAVDEKN